MGYLYLKVRQTVRVKLASTELIRQIFEE